MHRTSTFQYCESDICDMYVEMNIYGTMLMEHCYIFMCDNQPSVNILFGMPLDRHYNMLLSMM